MEDSSETFQSFNYAFAASVLYTRTHEGSRLHPLHTLQSMMSCFILLTDLRTRGMQTGDLLFFSLTPLFFLLLFYFDIHAA